MAKIEAEKAKKKAQGKGDRFVVRLLAKAKDEVKTSE